MREVRLAELWREMAADSFSAAGGLFSGTGHLRSALSRAYYAAYARVVTSLLQSDVVLPSRGNPGHRRLPALILNNLKGVSGARAARVCGAIDTLYKLRLVADYQADAVVDETDARVSFSLMGRVFKDLKEALL